MAAPAVDTIITVKQHGFVVKDQSPTAPISPRRAAPPGAAAAEPHRRPAPLRLEESTITTSGGGGAGSSSLSTGLLSSLTPLQSSSLSAAPTTTDYGVSPGLPRTGDVHLAEYTHLTPGVKRLMRSVVRGLKAHQDPEAATEGLGGTYFFRNEAGAKIAIMKPCDEEPLAPNNPKGFVGRALGDPGLKPTVRVGEAASREVAAYLLDHDHFARVPHTVMVRMSHPVFHVAAPDTATAAAAAPVPASGEGGEDAASVGGSEGSLGDLPLKLGSLQEFVPHECDTSEVGASRFSLRDVQRIGILDVRLFNTDRHAGNILVRRSSGGSGGVADLCLSKDLYDLIPIDHGFALPESLEPPYFEWQHWPQAMMPFGPEELDYIARLDPKGDADLLRRELPSLRVESLRVLEVSSTLLKMAAAAGLSLSEIAAVVTRPLIGLDDEPSELEKICVAAREEVDAATAAAAAAAAAAARVVSDEDAEDVSEEEEEEYSDLSDVEEGAEGDGTDLDDLRSPGAESAATHFDMPGSSTSGAEGDASDASRHTATMDDALFSMDEDDGTGVKTPAPGSPEMPPGLAKLKFRAPSLIVRRTGELATPGAVVGVSFGSALASTDGAASMPASYESDESPTGVAHRIQAGRGAGSDSIDSANAFGGAATYIPGGFATAMKATAPGGAGAKARQRRRLGGGGGTRRSSKGARSQAYPPLVEPRRAAVAASAVFSDMDDVAWDHFMRIVVARVGEALRDCTWVQSSGNGQAPLMSCPKF